MGAPPSQGSVLKVAVFLLSWDRQVVFVNVKVLKNKAGSRDFFFGVGRAAVKSNFSSSRYEMKCLPELVAFLWAVVEAFT